MYDGGVTSKQMTNRTQSTQMEGAGSSCLRYTLMYRQRGNAFMVYLVMLEPVFTASLPDGILLMLVVVPNRSSSVLSTFNCRRFDDAHQQLTSANNRRVLTSTEERRPVGSAAFPVCRQQTNGGPGRACSVFSVYVTKSFGPLTEPCGTPKFSLDTANSLPPALTI